MLVKVARGVLWLVVVVGALYAVFFMNDELPRRTLRGA
jgi:hypothetical protein